MAFPDVGNACFLRRVARNACDVVGLASVGRAPAACCCFPPRRACALVVAERSAAWLLGPAVFSAEAMVWLTGEVGHGVPPSVRECSRDVPERGSGLCWIPQTPPCRHLAPCVGARSFASSSMHAASGCPGLGGEIVGLGTVPPSVRKSSLAIRGKGVALIRAWGFFRLDPGWPTPTASSARSFGRGVSLPCNPPPSPGHPEGVVGRAPFVVCRGPRLLAPSLGRDHAGQSSLSSCRCAEL